MCVRAPPAAELVEDASVTQRSRAFIALIAAVPLFGGVASCSDPVAGPCEEYNDHYDEHIMAMEGSLADNPEEWRESQRLLAACKESGGDPHTGDVRLG
jgi:hypothetical protein